ncbi:Endopolyphosphatase, partial [Piedraia hortae CBS 480.64]
AAPTQVPLNENQVQVTKSKNSRKLHGRFLHITDFHPDQFYKVHSKTDGDASCHHGHGSAGRLGSEISDCDSPYSLVNKTFDWIDKNLKNQIDFVVWTGDSARHDNDEKIPRTAKQVISSNEFMISKWTEVFGTHDDDTNPYNDYTIPIIPAIGNNDILPHNIMRRGPSSWTSTYAKMWRSFIPESQDHQFQQGAWFYVEVIPNKLAVFSLNTMYFFEKNGAADGCATPGEAGYRQFEWLRTQLQFLRDRGVKALISGHVPPIRTEAKTLWDETCWQKYTLWMHQFRDIIIGSLYGHNNYDHFILQDTHSLLKDTKRGKVKPSLEGVHSSLSSDYWLSLRDEMSSLPKKPKSLSWPTTAGHDKETLRERKFFHKIGGPWAENFSVSFLGPSVVPVTYPTLRVYEYNTTGLGDLDSLTPTWKRHRKHQKKKKKKKKKKKGRRKYKFTVPNPPEEGKEPGPGYKPQTLTLIGYQQFFANLTEINRGAEFGFQLYYDTRRDAVYGLRDLTVPRVLDLAMRIGRYSPPKNKKDIVRKRNKPWREFITRAYMNTSTPEDIE